MSGGHAANLALLQTVARALGPLLEQVVFVGGCVTGLLIKDEALPQVRPTVDVDLIVEVLTHSEYYRLERQLRQLGFRSPEDPDAPICRWRLGQILVDVMPTDTTVLGFSNRWYRPAMQEAVAVVLAEGLTIRRVTGPYFLATKLEAFLGRGQGDYFLSHDMEDLATVIDGRPSLVEEVRQAQQPLQDFLAQTFSQLLGDEDFRDALAGLLPPDSASQARLPLILDRLQSLTALG